ncbi:anti-sigma-D factor RsdA [Tsukamurella soli]|uniref:Anti-sigma-D factor RsdA sigma factor binding region domain-containing protein n=1 Tax=Tsukamurella soli TaxID=644556 RepID=A0ABP8KE61_9ACTN
MRPDGRTESFRAADTGFVDRVRDDGRPDIAAVRRDDELLDAVAGGGAVATDTHAEYELASLLAQWRDEIVTAPIAQRPTLEEVLAAPSTARRSPARRFQLVAGAAAAFIAVVVGALVFVQRSNPGDPLWNVKSVMFAQQASQTLVTSEAKAQLNQASAALQTGDRAGVATALAQVRAKVDTVRDPKVRAALEQQARTLAAAAGLPTDTPTAVAQLPSILAQSSTQRPDRGRTPTSPGASAANVPDRGHHPPVDVRAPVHPRHPPVDRPTSPTQSTVTAPPGETTATQVPPIEQPVTTAPPDRDTGEQPTQVGTPSAPPTHTPSPDLVGGSTGTTGPIGIAPGRDGGIRPPDVPAVPQIPLTTVPVPRPTH